ncbi:MAG: hypothetical protein AB2417_19375 [Clostridiaceae bacterium]
MKAFVDTPEGKQAVKEMLLNEWIKNNGSEQLDSKEIDRIGDILCMNGKNAGTKDAFISIYSLDALQILVEQNWLMLKKLDSIDKSLKELNNK